MRVVVTGATGNFGTSVLGELSQDPAVETIVGLSRRRPTTALPKVEWQQADVSTSALHGIFEGADAIVHLAWLIQPSHRRRILDATNVIGSERVFRAASEVGAKAIVHASSVGVYSAASKVEQVDETWPTEGIPTSTYSLQKAAVERRFWALAERFPETRFVALRPGLLFKREAAHEIQRYFLGPLVTRLQPKSRPIPLMPNVRNLIFQSLYTGDAAAAVRLVLSTDVKGAFNLAANPILDGPTMAEAIDVRSVRIPGSLLRGLATLSWHARLQPTDAGWLDLAMNAPLMDCHRATQELGWAPTVTATAAFQQLVQGMSGGGVFPTPPLSTPEH